MKVQEKSYEEIRKSFEESLNTLLNELIFEDVKAILEQARSIVEEIKMFIPTRYEKFQIMVNLYTERFIHMLRFISQRANELTNYEILNVTSWVVEYQYSLIGLGVNESLAHICIESGSIDLLVDTYVERFLSTTKIWFLNILEVDKKIKETKDGKLYTLVGVELFRTLQFHIEIIRENNSVEILLYKISLAMIQVMVDFQTAEKKIFEEEISVEHFCAMVNNNLRFYDFGLELSNSILESLPNNYAKQFSFEDTCEGFLDIAKEAMLKIVSLIFEDPLVHDLLVNLYTKEWSKGKVTKNLVETFDQYFTQVKMYIEESFFGRFVEACLEKTVIVYVDNLLSQKKYIKEETIEQMWVDEEVIMTFFWKHISVFEVEKRMRILSDLRELASRETSLDSFTFIYKNILKHQPDCPPQVVEKLIGLRKGIYWKDANKIIEKCKVIYQNSLIDGRPPKRGFVFSKVKFSTMSQSQGGFRSGLNRPIQMLTHVYKLIFNRAHK